MSSFEVARLCLFALAGMALGVASFATLRMNTLLYASSRPMVPIALHFIRLAALAAAFVLAARFGAAPLLAAFGGLVLTRPLVVPILARAR